MIGSHRAGLIAGRSAAAAASRGRARASAAKIGKGRVVDEPARHDGDRLDYLADMIADLHRMAEGGDMPTLAYFLGMAHIEAQSLRDAKSRSGRRRNKRNPVA